MTILIAIDIFSFISSFNLQPPGFYRYRIFHRLAEGLNMKIFMVDSRQEKAAEKFAPKKANKGVVAAFKF